MLEGFFGLMLVGAALAVAFFFQKGTPVSGLNTPIDYTDPNYAASGTASSRASELLAVNPVSDGPTSRDHPWFTGQLQWSRAQAEEWIGRSSASWGVPAEILAGQCYVESSFRGNAKSGVGAQGPFQFLIPTASEQLKKEGYRLIGEDLQDFGLSCYLAGKYLAWLKRYLGDAPLVVDALDHWRYALSGYNAGPGKVKKGIRILSYEDDIIRYARTRGFVVIVDRISRDPYGDESTVA